MKRLSDMTWPEVDELPRDRTVFVLPVGATEAHGPHLPLGTDDLIAEAMAKEGARLLADRGIEVAALPTLSLTPAPFASEFSGTLSAGVEVVDAQIENLIGSLESAGFRYLAIANAHFDPANVGVLRRIAERDREGPTLAVIFPDVTRRDLARRLTEEFRSGACHAGRYEGSIVLSVRPDLYRHEIAEGLAPHSTSLVDAIGEGKHTFGEAGGRQAYFGDPAAATAAEGRATIRILGEILAEAVLERMG